MASTRQSKPTTALRICAALSLLVWVAASGFCSLEFVFGQAGSGTEHHSHASAEHQHAAAPAPDNSGHSHDSGQGEDHNDSCCASLKATPQFVSSVVVTKPDFGKPFSLHFLWLAPALTCVQPEAPSLRHAVPRDWVFTPEVFLGPALHSLAPPLAI